MSDNIDKFGLIPVTPEELAEIAKDLPGNGVRRLRRLARSRGKCAVCGENDAWRYGETGMCFPCTTGETDGSNDYELIESEA